MEVEALKLVVGSQRVDPGAVGCVRWCKVVTREVGQAEATTVSSVPYHRGKEGEGGRAGWGGEDKPLKVETGEFLALTVAVMLVYSPAVLCL